MFEKIFSLACINKKGKNKLALTAGPSESTVAVTQISTGTSTAGVVDESLSHSIVISEGTHLNTSNFMSNVTDVSYDAAAFQNRATPIDFSTREVKADDDVFSEASRRRSVNLSTPSPIPEETEDNLTDKTPYSHLENISRNTIFEPINHHYTPRPVKLRKQAHIYNANDSTISASSSSNNEESIRIDSVRARASKSACHQLMRGKLTPVLGGSLRPLRAKRHSVAFNGNSTFTELDRRRSDLERGQHDRLRLRKRGDTSRRDAVEAGFEPRDTVPRCHSTQSLRDVQRVRSYTNSQFQASDLSLNPNGSVRAACDSTSGSIVAPTAVVNPAQQITTRQHHNHAHRQQHHMSYDKDLVAHHHIDVDRRRSLQALNGSSALYQLSNGSPSGGRSQFSPSDLAVNAPVHVGSRVRVASVNQICDSTSVPQFSIDQRRSVQNIGQPVRNSFMDGIKTTSTPKNQIAVAPLTHKSRHLSESRDDSHGERRGSGGPIHLPAYNKYLQRQTGEERLIDGPINNHSDARIAYLEKRLRELELKEIQSSNSTPNQSRHSSSKSSYLNGSSNMSTSEMLRVQEMTDELAAKDRKVTSLESKLLKAYQRIERLNEEYEAKIKNLIYDGEVARDDLTRCVERIQELENQVAESREQAQNGDHATEQERYDLRDKIWKQERELQELRTLLTRLKEKETEFEKMRSEKGYLELKNENLNKKLEAKKRVVEELERSVSTLRLEQTICQQSCSSGSTPLADDMETMSDIRPSLARPYTKAHSTLGSNNMSPLSHSKSSGLTKSFSNFALNSSKQRDDITPMMSRSIREQNRHITMCRAMVVCLKDTAERMARGENPDVPRLLGVKLNAMSESEVDDDEDAEADESKPFSMMSAESTLSKQCSKLAELDRDLDFIRGQLANWHGQTNAEGEGDREVCRVQ